MLPYLPGFGLHHPAVSLSSPIAGLAAESFLRELRLLFGTEKAKGEKGRIDPGFNCMAVSFAVVHLCRLRGLEVDQCFGDLMFLEKAGANRHLSVISPHAWVGAPKHHDIDLSIADYESHAFLPVIHDQVAGPLTWHVKPTTDEQWFRETVRNFRGLPGDRYLLYLHKQRGIYRFDDLKAGAPATSSPPTQKLLGAYPDKELLAKGILHLHLLAQGQRASLTEHSREQAWGMLNDWQVQAICELAALLPKTFS